MRERYRGRIIEVNKIEIKKVNYFHVKIYYIIKIQLHHVFIGSYMYCVVINNKTSKVSNYGCRCFAIFIICNNCIVTSSRNCGISRS